jgi:hypothetical protein
MSAAKVPKYYFDYFWIEAFQTVTYLDELTVAELVDNKLTRFEHWERHLPRFINNLRK